MGWHRTGGAGPEQLVEAWGEPIRWCIETFGADRCMFESNFPVDKVSCTYADLWAAFELIAEGCSDAEHDALFAGTATARLPAVALADLGERRAPRSRSHAATSAASARSATSSGVRSSQPTQFTSAPWSTRHASSPAVRRGPRSTAPS